ncbi:MAG: NTP transferase domain-containing protein, partial [Microbacteriaceae bacterium]
WSMRMDAVVLAGGRSSRLAGRPKAQLVYRGTTLLERAITAAADTGARRIAVVGTDEHGAMNDRFLSARLASTRLILTREDPPFGGPAAGIAAGIAALDAVAEDTVAEADAEADATTASVLVLACDLPQVARAVPALTAALPLPAGVDGVMLTDAAERAQPLTAIYRWSALHAAIAERRGRGELNGLSVRALLGTLEIMTVTAPPGSTDDIDTPADAARFDIALPAPKQTITEANNHRTIRIAKETHAGQTRR